MSVPLGGLITLQDSFGTPMRSWTIVGAHLLRFEGPQFNANQVSMFEEFIAPAKANLPRPVQSPDTTKYRTVCQGDTLWAFSAREYGQPEQWRAIADANGLDNPRRLRSGERLVVPALKRKE